VADGQPLRSHLACTFAGAMGARLALIAFLRAPSQMLGTPLIWLYVEESMLRN
jgi:hypothetical protein